MLKTSLLIIETMISNHVDDNEGNEDSAHVELI